MEQNKIGKIYRLECPDGYFYIGSTIQTLKDRLLSHKYNITKNINTKLYNHIKQFNWTTIKITLIEEIQYKNNRELLLKESDYIEKEINNSLCLNTIIPFNKNKKSTENKFKIYKLLCTDGYFYIGSTISSLSTRLKNHKKDSKLSNSKLYIHINLIGWDKVKIILVEELNLTNKSDVLEKEYEYIRNESSTYCLNTNIFNNKLQRIKNRKQYEKQYEIINKEKIKLRKIKYRELNKGNINKKGLIYNELNKEKIKERRKIYYQNNKEKINLMNRENYIKNKNKIT